MLYEKLNPDMRQTIDDWAQRLAPLDWGRRGELLAEAAAAFGEDLSPEKSDLAGKGFLTAVPYEKLFPAQVILLREGWGGPPGGLQDVGLVDARFERRFKVFSNDQIESRVLLDPTVIEEVVHLDEAIGGARMQCAFAGQAVYVAIKTVSLPSGKDAWPRLWASVNKPDWVRSLAWDLYWSARLAGELKPAEAWTR